MYTQRVHKYECLNEDRAKHMSEGWNKVGYKSWVKGCVVYWIKSSTD